MFPETSLYRDKPLTHIAFHLSKKSFIIYLFRGDFSQAMGVKKKIKAAIGMFSKFFDKKNELLEISTTFRPK